MCMEWWLPNQTSSAPVALLVDHLISHLDMLQLTFAGFSEVVWINLELTFTLVLGLSHSLLSQTSLVPAGSLRQGEHPYTSCMSLLSGMSVSTLDPPLLVIDRLKL